MSEKLFETLSAAMDNEASEFELRRVFDEARRNPRLRDAWGRYHAIGAALRDELHAGDSELRERIRDALQADRAEDDVCSGPHVEDNPKCDCWWRRVMKLRVQWRS